MTKVLAATSPLAQTLFPPNMTSWVGHAPEGWWGVTWLGGTRGLGMRRHFPQVSVSGMGLLGAELAGFCQDGFPGNRMLSGSSGIWRMGIGELGTSCLAGEHHPLPPGCVWAWGPARGVFITGNGVTRG